MSYSPNPLNHAEISGVQGLYCTNCLTECSEAQPCSCDRQEVPEALKDSEGSSADVTATAGAQDLLFLIEDSDAGTAGDSHGG